MDNEFEFKKFIERDGILNKGEVYSSDTKRNYLKIFNNFNTKINKDIYSINEVSEIKNILESQKDFIRSLSASHLKVSLGWYINFLESKEKEDEYTSADEIHDNENYFEGSRKKVYVNAYERNSQARKKCLEKYGYKCSICSFDFKSVYGELGDKFIHVHHIKPLSEINEEYRVNPIEDLRPLCPNCHAMIHRRKPIYKISELKKIIENVKEKSRS